MLTVMNATRAKMNSINGTLSLQDDRHICHGNTSKCTLSIENLTKNNLPYRGQFKSQFPEQIASQEGEKKNSCGHAKSLLVNKLFPLVFFPPHLAFTAFTALTDNPHAQCHVIRCLCMDRCVRIATEMCKSKTLQGPSVQEQQSSPYSWTPSNPATLGTCQSVLIRGVASFQG